MNRKLLFLNSIGFGYPAIYFPLRVPLNVLTAIAILLSFTQSSKCQTSISGVEMGPVWMNGDRVSGNFGELRGNHFHSGIDYKTDEKEGKPVFAAADGFISRIKVSAGGYGKALYMTHSSGIVTVYGHLRIFNPALEDTIRKIQQKSRKYDLEIFPDSGRFSFQMGNIIGYTGNTGSSEGPHLHFETRHRESEKPFNPELAGFSITDTIPPVVSALMIYEPGPFEGLWGASRQIISKDSTSSKIVSDTVIVNSNFFIGFESSDKAGVENNNLGIRAFKLFLNDSLVFYSDIDSFSFDETRIINAAIDYNYYKVTGRKFLLCHTLKGNRLSFYKNLKGIIGLIDSRTYRLKLKVEDSSGNFSEAGCYIKNSSVGKDSTTSKDGLLCLFGNSTLLHSKNYSVKTAPFSFYEDIRITHGERNDSKFNATLLSPLITIGTTTIPVHDPIIISIKPYQEKNMRPANLVAVQIDTSGTMTPIPAKYEKGWMTFKSRNLGDFAIVADSIPPATKTPVWEPDDYSGKRKLVFAVNDAISGIYSVNCFINSIWVPAVYNFRKNQINIYPEDLPGQEIPFKIQLELEDNAGNTGKYDFLVSFE